MKLLRYIFCLSVILLGCENENKPDPKNKFNFELEDSTSFPIGHHLGLNYFNDITVGVIAHSENEIKLLTAVNTSSYVFSGSDLSNITEVTPVALPVPDKFYSNYVGLGQLIKDPNGVIYSVFHSEKHNGKTLPGNIPGFYASVGLGISTDNGTSFQLNEEPLIKDVYDINHDSGGADGGLGEPSITYSRDKTEVYVYYVDHNRVGRGVNICMAKFKVDENGVPDFSISYYLNDDSEFTTDLIRSKEIVVGEGYSDAIFPQVTYNAFIDKYVMVYSLNHYGEYHNGAVSAQQSGVYYRESEDGINWTQAPRKLITDWSIPYSFDKHSFSWHPNLIYSNESQSEGHLVYSRASSLKEGHKMWAIKFKYSQN